MLPSRISSELAMKRLLCYIAFLMILVSGIARTARAAEAEPDSFVQIATSWDQRLDYAESIIARSANTIDEHPQIRQILLEIQRDAGEAGKRFTADAQATKRLLDALGPEPEKGAPPEEKDVADTRAELQQKLAAARARVARTEIALSRARDLSTEVRDDFRNQFLETLTQRLPLPDSIDDVRDGAREVSRAVFSIVAAPIAWWQGLSPAEKRLVFLHWQPYAALALLVAAILLSRPLLRRWGHDPSITAPSYRRRLLAAFVSLATIGIVPALVLAGTASWVRAEASPIPGYLAHVVATLCEMMIILVLIVAFAWAWLRPSDPAWRIAPLKTTSARRLYWRIILVGVIFAGHRFLLNAAAAEAIAALPVASRILYGVSYTVLAAIAIVLMCRDNGWKKTRQNEAANADQPETEDALLQIGNDALLGGDTFRFFRRFISFVVVGAFFAVSAGYVRLSYYFVDNILFTGAVLTALVILRRAGREAFHAALAVSPRARKLDLSAGENQSGPVCWPMCCWLHAGSS